MKKKRTFISFDWALKHLLREKAKLVTKYNTSPPAAERCNNHLLI